MAENLRCIRQRLNLGSGVRLVDRHGPLRVGPFKIEKGPADVKNSPFGSMNLWQ